MKLKEYNAKRNFSNTPEPSGADNKHSENKSALKFVVQKHQASHLHYDFRLEHNGVMLSWAVPKGPSLDPAVKRLAMMVEDHPLEYRNFEGTIPEGNYGAGTVMIWDEGTYAPVEAEGTFSDQLERGDLKFKLFGKKLEGEFALVRLKGEKNKDAKSWLLIKHRDEFAGKSIDGEDFSVRTGMTLDEISQEKKHNTKLEKQTLPSKVSPMLASLATSIPTGSKWQYELKWDGYRALAEIKDGNVKLYSRNGQDFTEKYSEITRQLKKLNGTMLLDGEIVAVNEKGISKFQYLQQHDTKGDKPLLYYVFDILYFDRFDLRRLPLRERRALLEQVVKPNGRVQLSETFSSGDQLFKQASELGFEGIIVKDLDSEYEETRTPNWLKVKNILQQEFVIGGYTEPKGERKGFGSLLLGQFVDGRLEYVGHVGTGFDSGMIFLLKKKLDKVAIKNSPFADSQFIVRRNVAQWLKPEYVAQVKFAEWTQDNLLRQAVFLGLREDKDASDVKPEVTVSDKKSSGSISLDSTRAELSNLTKVYWPKEIISGRSYPEYTKGDLLEYYATVAPIMMPYLVDRLQNLNRHPNGIHGKNFFHKDFEQKHPSWLRTKDVHSESTKDDISYVIADNPDSLLYLANLGCIEINVWNSRAKTLEKPDYLIFDLDPVEIKFEKVTVVARELNLMLAELELPSFVKTSGKRGLHIYVPTGSEYKFEQVRLLAELLAHKLQQRLPDLVSLERSPADRKGKVYIDYLQNRIGQTTACVYSVRPVPGATVSTPLSWEEINSDLDPQQFTINTIPARIKQRGDLWNGLLEKEINIEKILSAI